VQLARERSGSFVERHVQLAQPATHRRQSLPYAGGGLPGRTVHGQRGIGLGRNLLPEGECLLRKQQARSTRRQARAGAPPLSQPARVGGRVVLEKDGDISD
jgi:hypothetical protein